MENNDYQERERYVYPKSMHAGLAADASSVAERQRIRQFIRMSVYMAILALLLAIWLPWRGLPQLPFYAVSILQLANGVRLHSALRRRLALKG